MGSTPFTCFCSKSLAEETQRADKPCFTFTVQRSHSHDGLSAEIVVGECFARPEEQLVEKQ